MCVEVHRHELQHPRMFLNKVLELRLPFVDSEGHCSRPSHDRRELAL